MGSRDALLDLGANADDFADDFMGCVGLSLVSKRALSKKIWGIWMTEPTQHG